MVNGGENPAQRLTRRWFFPFPTFYSTGIIEAQNTVEGCKEKDTSILRKNH